MSQSSLVTRTWWANGGNYTPGRSDTIHGIVIHHAASTNLDSVGQAFATPGRGGSAHYGVKGQQIHQYVREEDTAWHCGDWAGNCCTIGIETVNSTGAPSWLVDDETFETLAKLVADIAKRNNLGTLKFDPNGTYPTLSAHRDWSPTYCPGDYLYSKMNQLADRANAINNPTPATAELKWSKLSAITPYKCKDNPAHLVDFNHTHAENCKNVQEYPQGTIIDIYGKCENKTIGKTYLVTEYSYTKKKTNGFRETHMEKVEQTAKEPADEPKPAETIKQPTEPEKPQETAPDTSDEVNKRGLTAEDYDRIVEEMKATAKETHMQIKLSNKAYDILKLIAIVILPLVATLWAGISQIWGIGFSEQINQTIQLIIAAINTLLGITLVKSSSDYKAEQ